MSASEHWQQIARRWDQVGSPLRPAPDDLRHFAELLNLRRPQPFRALILGVTPELSRLPWPAGSSVLAVDRSPEMIRAIWPGPAEAAYCANWLDLPFEDGAFDAVLCDGGLHLLGFPQDHAAFARSVARVLSTEGHLLLRLFALPAPAERPDAVWHDLTAGRIANFHVFKLRMAMALQSTSAAGIILSKVYDAIQELAQGRLETLCELTGWPRAEVATLESYRNSANVYHFLTEADSIAALASSPQLVLCERRVGGYPLSERCPVLLFRKA